MINDDAPLLGGMPAAHCAIVRAGTSSVVVLDGRTIRPGEAGKKEVLRIILGQDFQGGLGGKTSQDNKAALAWPADKRGRFRFRFLQVIPHSRKVLPMECSNAAAASALLPQLVRGVSPEHPVIHTRNLSTGQPMELYPEIVRGVPRSCGIRFLVRPADRQALRGFGRPFELKIGRRKLRCNPVLRGNLFLFTEIDPEEMTEEIMAGIERAGMRAARKSGFQPPSGYHPKVVPFQVLERGEKSAVKAASFYHGERHRSMPGSAAMALTGFLETKLGSVDQITCCRWKVHHPSGEFEVRLGFHRKQSEIEWAEFTTPVHLIGWGAAALPWRRG
ncbi:MAG: hypothetical protein MK108_08195 [Mariniblastus sp.]|nr:hypothetical protein [Mariniblastus sp.]